MLTFKSNYQTFGEKIGFDLVTYPDRLLTDMTLSARCAAAFWAARACNVAADIDNIARVTQLINGGLDGLPQRKENLSRLKALWGL
jgi:putative chitinase